MSSKKSFFKIEKYATFVYTKNKILHSIFEKQKRCFKHTLEKRKKIIFILFMRCLLTKHFFFYKKSQKSVVVQKIKQKSKIKYGFIRNR